MSVSVPRVRRWLLGICRRPRCRSHHRWTRGLDSAAFFPGFRNWSFRAECTRHRVPRRGTASPTCMPTPRRTCSPPRAMSMPRTASGPWTSTATSPRDVLPNCSVPTRSPPTPTCAPWAGAALRSRIRPPGGGDPALLWTPTPKASNAYLEGKSATEVSWNTRCWRPLTASTRLSRGAPSTAWPGSKRWRGPCRQHARRDRPCLLLARGSPREQVEELYPATRRSSTPPSSPAAGSATGSSSTRRGGAARRGRCRHPRHRCGARAGRAAGTAGSDPAHFRSCLRPGLQLLGGVRRAHCLRAAAARQRPPLSAVMPSIWYQMGLHCTTVDESCPFDVTGFTFPA